MGGGEGEGSVPEISVAAVSPNHLGFTPPPQFSARSDVLNSQPRESEAVEDGASNTYEYLRQRSVLSALPEVVSFRSDTHPNDEMLEDLLDVTEIPSETALKSAIDNVAQVN